jgi:hypothetical protein
MGKEDKMLEAQKEESAKKVQYCKEVIDMMLEEGLPVTPYSVWKKTALSKTFIYKNEEIANYIEEHRSDKKYNYTKYSQQDVMIERIEILERENTRLRKELNRYKSESLEHAITENAILHRRLAYYEKLVTDGLIPPLPEEQ